MRNVTSIFGNFAVIVSGLSSGAMLTAAMVVGLAATPGAPIDDVEPSPPLVSLITMAATMVIFAARLEYKMLAALLDWPQATFASKVDIAGERYAVKKIAVAVGRTE